MADTYVTSGADSCIGDYTDVTGVIGATAAAQVAALQSVFVDLLGNEDTGNQAAHPDFNKIDPATRAKILVEVAAIFAAIAAAPTA